MTLHISISIGVIFVLKLYMEQDHKNQGNIHPPRESLYLNNQGNAGKSKFTGMLNIYKLVWLHIGNIVMEVTSIQNSRSLQAQK